MTANSPALSSVVAWAGTFILPPTKVILVQAAPLPDSTGPRALLVNPGVHPLFLRQETGVPASHSSSPPQPHHQVLILTDTGVGNVVSGNCLHMLLGYAWVTATAREPPRRAVYLHGHGMCWPGSRSLSRLVAAIGLQAQLELEWLSSFCLWPLHPLLPSPLAPPPLLPQVDGKQGSLGRRPALKLSPHTGCADWRWLATRMLEAGKGER